MKIYLIGIGMNGRETLTMQAQNAIAESELLIGAKRMISPFSDRNKKIFISYDTPKIADYLHQSGVKTASVLFSGDAGFFSGAEKLLPFLADDDTEIISGISSPVYFSAKIHKSWENMKFITLHGTENPIAVHVRQNQYCFFLLGGEMTAAKLCERLCKYHLKDVRIYLGENLGYENEKIFSGLAREFLQHPETTLSVLVTENLEFCQYLPSGIPDDAFLRTKIPMTKQQIRSIIISHLQIGKSDICYDIGSGTGSVSVEMAFQCRQVYAFDKNPDAVALTLNNAERFSCDNIQAIHGDAPEILADYPAPDKVFIGGSSGRVKQIFDMIYQKNPNARILITAVSLETLSEAVQAFEAYQSKYEITQIAVTETKKIGTHTMLNAQNPIFIIRGDLHCIGS